MQRSMDFDIRAIAINKQKYPDEYLIRAINGGVQGMPPFIAMAAGQKRKEIMTAGQGAEAAQKLNKGTVKDKIAAGLQADEIGLAMLPAENMAGMDEAHLAGGGIIAFDNRGLVPNVDDNSIPDPEDAKNPLAFLNPGDILSGMGKYFKGNWEKNKAIREGTYNMPNTVSQADALRNDPYRSAPAATATPTAGVTFDPTAGGNPAVANLKNQKQTGGVGTPPNQSAAAAAAAQNLGIGEPPKRVDRFAGLGQTQEAFDKSIAEEKKAGQADFLMTMGLKMMGAVGPLGKATSEGGLAALPSLGASRKVIRELQKGRQDYQFNMAKAQSALDQGDRDLAYKYKALAEKTAHDMGMLAVEKTKAGAYAASVGSRADIREDKLNTAILSGATALHKQNMENFKFASEFAKMDPISKQQYFANLRSQAAQLAGKHEESNVAGTGYSMSDIDAAIARKQKQS